MASEGGGASVEIQRTLTALSRLCETRGKHVLVYGLAPLDNGYSRAMRSKHSSDARTSTNFSKIQTLLARPAPFHAGAVWKEAIHARDSNRKREPEDFKPTHYANSPQFAPIRRVLASVLAFRVNCNVLQRRKF